MNEDLKIIKKLYGEKMMHLCRTYFPTILETPTLLSRILQEHFYPTHDLYEDLINNHKENEFKNFIYKLIGKEYKPKNKINKTPEELLSLAGYDLYECHTEEEIQSFKKYYQPSEELCTFRGRRLNRCRVFFAVKKDVANIKREDFSNPLRQDLYGTSVISIQFTKDGTNALSIKNRYNHSVADPDATFSNDLDNIIAGLTASFEKYYGIVQSFKSQNFEIPGYVHVKDKYYKYNYEINNYYYCPNNIVIDNWGNVHEYDHEKYIVMDYFILDLVNKKLIMLNNIDEESFVNDFKDITKIAMKKNGDTKDIFLSNSLNQTFNITLDKQNKIVSLKNTYIKKIPDNYLYYNTALKSIEIPNVKKIGDNFLYYNQKLENIAISNVKEIGDYFLTRNESLQELNAPNLVKIGYDFLSNNTILKKINLPSLEKVSGNFLCDNNGLEFLQLPKLKECNDDFMYNNNALINFSAPLLTNIGNRFLGHNNTLKNLSLPSLKYVGHHFLSSNSTLISIEVPSLKQVGHYFLRNSLFITKLVCPFLTSVGDCFMRYNYNLEYFVAPCLTERGSEFLLLADRKKLKIPRGVKR